MEHIVHELAKTDFLVYSYAADGTATFPTRVSPVLLESRVWIRGTGALMGLNNGVYYAGAALADWARERGCIWEGNHFGVGLRACTDAGWNYIRGRGKGENMMKTKTEGVIVTKRRSGLTFNDIEEGELFKIGANIRVHECNSSLRPCMPAARPQDDCLPIYSHAHEPNLQMRHPHNRRRY